MAQNKKGAGVVETTAERSNGATYKADAQEQLEKKPSKKDLRGYLEAVRRAELENLEPKADDLDVIEDASWAEMKKYERAARLRGCVAVNPTIPEKSKYTLLVVREAFQIKKENLKKRKKGE